MEIFCPLYRNGGLRGGGHHANAPGNLSTAGELNNTLSDVLRARLEHTSIELFQKSFSTLTCYERFESVMQLIAKLCSSWKEGASAACLRV